MSVPEHAARVLELLRERGSGQWVTFGELVAECEQAVEIVARFLGLLELYRGRSVLFDQREPLGDLLVTWTGDEEGSVITAEDYG